MWLTLPFARWPRNDSQYRRCGGVVASRRSRWSDGALETQSDVAGGAGRAISTGATSTGTSTCFQRAIGTSSCVARWKYEEAKAYEVNEEFGNITEWRDLLGDAHESWHPPESERRLADAFSREFKPTLKELSGALKDAATALSEPGRRP